MFEVNYSDAIIDNGAEVVRFISKHHGAAGEKFIKHVAGKDLSGDYDNLVSEIMNSCDTTDKQAAVAALILLADKLACECIFVDETPLAVSDIAAFVKADNEVSTSKRAYDYIAGWVAANSDRVGGGGYGETWGTVQQNSVFIIDSVMSEALEEKSFSFDAVKKDWAEQGWLVKYRDKFKKRKTINGVAPYCVEIILPDATEVEKDVEEKSLIE